MKKAVLVLATILASQSVWAKGVEAHDAYARATVAGVKQSGAFVTLINTDAKDNALIGASVSTKLASRTELHNHVNDNGVMRMREVKEGVPLPAGQKVELKPGSYHVMFFDLKQALVAGKKFPLTLKFKDGSSKKVMVTVREMKATQSHGHHQHGDAHQH